METKKYSLKGYRGVNDLLPVYAFYGAAQGMGTSCSLKDYETSGGWLIPALKDISSQEAIDTQIEANKEANLKYIDSLVKEGRYKEEYETIIELVPNPLFDDNKIEFPLESYRMVFLDISSTLDKNNNVNIKNV